MLNSTLTRLGPLLAAIILMGGCASDRIEPREGRWFRYGEPMPESASLLPVAELRGGEQSVIVKGTIGQVCQTMGCWITLRDEHGREVFVQTRDHKFFVPRNAAGHRSWVWGWTERGTISVDQLRHFAEDAGQTPEQVAQITQPIERITLFARSILIEGDGLQPAEPPVR